MFKFYIKYGSPEVVEEVFPNYSELMFKQVKNTDFFYTRKILTTSLVFLGAAFVTLLNLPFTESFILEIYKKDTDGVYKIYYTSEAFKNDGNFDEDEKTAEFSFENVIDQYNNLERGIDKEFNVLSLYNNTKQVNYTKRGILQIYLTKTSIAGSLGSDYVTNFLGGNYWDINAINPTSNDTTLTSTYNFIKGKQIAVVRPFSFTAPPPPLSTTSYGNFTDDLSGGFEGFFNDNPATITKETDGGTLVRWSITENSTITFQTLWVDQINTIETVYFTSLTTSELISIDTFQPYLRMLTDVATISGVASVPIPSTDLVDTVNYDYVWNNNTLANLNVYGVTKNSIDENEWGRIQDDQTDEGKYYLKYPYFEGVDVPINRSGWELHSFWFFPSPVSVLNGLADSTFLVRDNYTLGSVVKSLLNEVAPEVTFLETAEYSQFLYNTNNPITSDLNPLLLLTPKTNIINGEYTRPATKGILTLKEVLNLFKVAFNCSFHIDSEYKMHLEHIRFFNNGGSYTLAESIYSDLTILQSKNTKKLSYFTNKYSYDKEKLLEEFNFTWGDNMSFIFSGFPVKSVSQFTQNGLVEYVNVGNFMPDIDYINSNIEDVNKDGFILTGAFLDSGNIYNIPILEQTINSATYYLQNGYVSNPYLHISYFLDEANSPEIIINEETQAAESLKRIKIQEEVYFPSPSFDLPADFDLIKTGLGNGRPAVLEYNGVTNWIKTILQHEFN